MDIEGARDMAYFEVTEIVDENNTYLELPGIDWEFDMNVVNNLNKCNITFKKKELGVIVPFNLTEGVQYTEPVQNYYEEDCIEHIYKLTMLDEDWINAQVDG